MTILWLESESSGTDFFDALKLSKAELAIDCVDGTARDLTFEWHSKVLLCHVLKGTHLEKVIISVTKIWKNVPSAFFPLFGASYFYPPVI